MSESLRTQNHAYLELWDESGRALGIRKNHDGSVTLLLDGVDFHIHRDEIHSIKAILNLTMHGPWDEYRENAL